MMTNDDLLAGLNPAQQEAVQAIEGPVLILAGPGSGKTRVITHRIAYLVRVCGVSPYRVLAVTFTNKAAREMTTRITRLAQGAVKSLTVGTFHAVCARILRQDGEALGINPRFVIYDSDDQISVVKRSLKEANLDPKQYPPRAILSGISNSKGNMLSPQEHLQKSGSYFEEVVGRVYERYEKHLAESDALDFDDLLMKVSRLFSEHPEALQKYQQRYVHVMVDEFQDTNLTQYQIVKQLSAASRNICVVGDPDQSIYSWRAADVRNILNFGSDYPDAKIIKLEQNYRSTGTILDAASGVIKLNRVRKRQELWTENERGAPITLVETYNEQEEAQFVVSEIERLSGQDKASLGECAVMFRTNAQSRALEEAFLRYGIAYRLVAGTRFYERREVKDIIAYLRLMQNPHDSVSLRRVINVPVRGIGQRSLMFLQNYALENNVSEYDALRLITSGDTPPDGIAPQLRRALKGYYDLISEMFARSRGLKLTELFELVLERTGYREFLMNGEGGEERWENILELRTVAEEYSEYPPGEGLTAFLEGVALVSDTDNLEEGAGAVTLITLHQAKGLEFPVVFMVGMEDGVLPHIRSIDDPGQLEEERRLCYVGITRAERLLYLVRAFRRSLMGQSSLNKPSRFLEDIPSALTQGGSLKSKATDVNQALHAWNRPRPEPIAAEPSATPAAPNFRDGDRVRHEQFGEGLVVSLKPSDSDYVVVVAFDAGVKKLLLSFARLEKIG
jgi:ATP-dependent DNA helicase UvrD/PcrA